MAEYKLEERVMYAKFPGQYYNGPSILAALKNLNRKENWVVEEIGGKVWLLVKERSDSAKKYFFAAIEENGDRAFDDFHRNENLKTDRVYEYIILLNENGEPIGPKSPNYEKEYKPMLDEIVKVLNERYEYLYTTMIQDILKSQESKETEKQINDYESD